MIDQNRTLQDGHNRQAIWVTRPAQEAQQLAGVLETAGYTPLVAPMLDIVPRSEQITLPPDAAAFLVTSANAVRALAALTTARKLPIITVGDASTQAAQTLGFHHVTNSAAKAEANSHSMADYIIQHYTPADGKMVHLSGQTISGTLHNRLTQAGFTYQQLTVYDAKPVTKLPAHIEQTLIDEQLATVLFYSARTASTTIHALQQSGYEAHIKRLNAVCLSAQVARAIASMPWQHTCVMSGTSTQDLLAALQELGYKISQ